MPHSLKAELSAPAEKALELAGEWAFKNMIEDGSWSGEMLANVSFTAEFVFFRQCLGIPFEDSEKEGICKWLWAEQNSDGSWGLAPDCPGFVSYTAEAYLALKILGVTADDERMQKAKGYILGHGGLEKVRMFTRLFFASFGLMPWGAVPRLPTELILLPTWSPVNIYNLSSWARTTCIPLLLVRHHEPIYALPNGKSKNNNFIDELWLNPMDKMLPYGQTFFESLRKRDMVGFLFTNADRMMRAVSSIINPPLRNLTRKLCVNWILQHQEVTGDWAGYWPPQYNSILALTLEGYSMKHPVILQGLEALEKTFIIRDDDGIRAQVCPSPVWDTILMSVSLCDASPVIPRGENLQKAMQWIRDHQLTSVQGDWRVYAPDLISGGFCFQDFNTLYPDVDDTAAALLAFIKENPKSLGSDPVLRGAEWILGMQNRDGGWGAFDLNNDKLFLNKIPFGDMESFCDPSTADVTGRVIEAFGLMIFSPHSHLLDESFLERLRTSSARGIAYLRVEQEKTGSKTGSWWGRWGSNYIYGTSNVLCALVPFCDVDKALYQRMVLPGIKWLKSRQNQDGGWGETLMSYDDPKLAGIGPSTAGQTAWGLMALLAYLPPSDESIQKAVAYLVATQVTQDGKYEGTWQDINFTGTGFPGHLYLGYSYYCHYFPIMALGRYVAKVKKSTGVNGAVNEKANGNGFLKY